MMLKEVIAVTFVIVMAAVTVCICSSENAQNYDGTWIGNTSYNGEVELTVSGNNITRFSISVKEVPVDLFDKTTGSKNGTANSSTKYTCNAFNAPIVNSKFHYTPTPPDTENTIAGIFTSIRETEGTWKYKHEDLWGVVRVYPLITWSATRVGATTPTPTSTPMPTPTPTPIPTPIPTPTPTQSLGVTPMLTPTFTPTHTSTPPSPPLSTPTPLSMTTPIVTTAQKETPEVLTPIVPTPSPTQMPPTPDTSSPPNGLLQMIMAICAIIGVVISLIGLILMFKRGKRRR